MKYLQDYINNLDEMYENGDILDDEYRTTKTLMLDLISGLPPDRLTKQEVKMLEYVFNTKDWFSMFGYETKEYKRSKYDAKYRKQEVQTSAQQHIQTSIPLLNSGTVKVGISYAQIALRANNSLETPLP